MSWLSKLFEFTASPRWSLGVMFLDVAMVPVVLFWSIGHEEYLPSALLGAVLTMLADPGGPIGRRCVRLAIFTLAGAGVTALAVALGSAAWGWLVLASFLVTLAASLSLVLGVHAFVGGVLLNVWFIIAIALGRGLHQHPVIDNHLWAQVAAWAGGCALWIAVAFVVWLVAGRDDMAAPVADIPTDSARRKLTAQVIAFAVLRAIAIAGATALAYGLDLSYGYWLPIATIVALKSSLQQSTVASAQRLVGALLGGIVAGLLLLIPASEHGLRLFSVDRGLEVVATILLMHAAATRFWNYTIYTAAVAAAVLVLVDLPHPTNYSSEGYRVLWTVTGLAIGVVVMLLADLLAKRKRS